VRQSLKKRGVLGTVWRCLLGPYYVVRNCRRIRRNYGRSLTPDSFDLTHGIETTSRVHLTDLNIESPNWIHAGGYWPSPTDLVKEALSELKIRYEDFVFVDFGSGKGRVLLIASELPFRKVIGVEFSAELHAIAQQNIRAYKSATQKCKDIELVCMDFTQFAIPNDPLVAFLYNPADEQIMNALVNNMMRSVEGCPRELWVIYVTPSYKVFDTRPKLRKLKASERYALYTNAAGLISTDDLRVSLETTAAAARRTDEVS